MENQRTIYYLFLLWIMSSWAMAQPVEIMSESRTSIFQEIQAIETPHIILTTNLEELLEKGREEQDATFQIDGSDQVWNIEIEARGKYRRKICYFPPIRLNFKKSDLEEASYLPFDKLKLVTHCSDDASGVESIYKEYVAYQAYNYFTEESFKAKLVQITYVDAEKPEHQIASWGIILEPNDEMAQRLGGECFDKWNLPADSLVADNYLKMSLFQFMIGNHDWSIEMNKNIKCVFREDLGKYLIVPYDFDFTGMVDPQYYLSDSENQLMHPKDRIYLGKHFQEQVPKVIAQVLGKKKDIQDFLKSFQYLNGTSRSEINSYLNRFFKKLKKDTGEVKYEYRIPYSMG